MKPEIKAKLLIIIKSGLVTKHKYRLRSSKKKNCFCVNGLICNIFDSSKWVISDREIWFYNDTHSATLPDNILSFADMTEAEVGRLVHANDNNNDSWDAVIKVLEAI